MAGTIISIINNKGGVGKTTTAVNLAHALAQGNNRVLLIDNDSQCNATHIMMDGIEYERTLYHFLTQQPPLDTCIYGTSYRNVFCIPNKLMRDHLEFPLGQKETAVFLYRDQIQEYARENFDFVLIDNPPALSVFVHMALNMSDFAIVPCEAGSRNSMEGLINAVGFIKEISKKYNPNLRFLRLLITMVDKRTNACNNIIKTIQAIFKPTDIFATMIPVNAAFQTAELARRTIIRFNSSATGAKAYRQLAAELQGILMGQEARDKKRSKAA